MNRSLCSFLLGAAALAVAHGAAAQASKPSSPQGDTWESIAKLPDWGGIWEVTFGGGPRGAGEPPQFTPKYAAMLEDYGKYGKLIKPVSHERQEKFWSKLKPMEPDEFARQALRGVAKNRSIILIPRWWRVIWWLNRLSPALGQRMARSELERTKSGME